jgi:hypothetical protein
MLLELERLSQAQAAVRPPDIGQTVLVNSDGLNAGGLLK